MSSNQKNSPLTYRREIDGLRAVAVIPVILFHAGFSAFGGGFVGVDVFFVLSGYLITSIILVEKERRTFSLVNFYERRARRILPALFLMMLVCIPYAWMWLRPEDFRSFAQSLVAVPTFSSNILFWREIGYFASASELKPLLHTWSLAVEEQYYLLFPLLLMMLWFLRKRWIFGILTAGGLISFALAQWGSHNTPSATFFLLPTRAWELTIGSIVAFISIYKGGYVRHLLKRRMLAEWLGIAGVGLIAYAVFAFDESVPFPSAHALIPTLGAALIILFATWESAVGRMLGHKALVGVGLVSYSAYLWHQPLFSFARHRSIVPPSEWLLLGLSVLAIGLAYISWRYVEQPFRRKDVIGRRAIFGSTVLGSVAFVTVGVVGAGADGVAQRPTGIAEVTRGDLERRLEPNWGLDVACAGAFSSPACRTSDNPEIVVWGDSIAMHLVPGILASNPAAEIIQMTKSVCGPFFDVAPTSLKFPKSWSSTCSEFNDDVWSWIRDSESVKYVVMSSPFIQYLTEGWGVVSDGEVIDAGMDIALREFRNTLEEIKELGVRPVIFSPLPRTGQNVGLCLSRASTFSGDLDACNFTRDDINELSWAAVEFLEIVDQDYSVIWLDKFICSGGVCESHLAETFVFRDEIHLSREGSAALGRKHDFYGLITSYQ